MTWIEELGLDLAVPVHHAVKMVEAIPKDIADETSIDCRKDIGIH